MLVLRLEANPRGRDLVIGDIHGQFSKVERELERISFGTVRADADNDTLSLEGTWRNIRFEQAGVHDLVLYWQGRAVARFHLVVR